MKNTYHVFKNSVTVHVNGKTLTLSKDDVRYAKIMGIIEQDRLDEMEGILHNAECIAKIENLIGID